MATRSRRRNRQRAIRNSRSLGMHAAEWQQVRPRVPAHKCRPAHAYARTHAPANGAYQLVHACARHDVGNLCPHRGRVQPRAPACCSIHVAHAHAHAQVPTLLTYSRVPTLLTCHALRVTRCSRHTPAETLPPCMYACRGGGTISPPSRPSSPATPPQPPPIARTAGPLVCCTRSFSMSDISVSRWDATDTYSPARSSA